MPHKLVPASKNSVYPENKIVTEGGREWEPVLMLRRAVW